MENAKLGKVVKLHGFRGEMKVSTKYDSDFDIKNIKSVFDETGAEFEISRIFKVPDGVVFGLAGVDLEKAKTYVNKNFYVSREILTGKILFEDLKNSNVYAGEKLIGKVVDVQDYGAAEVIFVMQENKEELMFPNVNGIIEKFDLETKSLHLNSNKLKEVSDYEDWYFVTFSRKF